MVIAAAQLMVVLDTAIVNVALPHIQGALHFSGTNLEWVVNAYTLAFGGLLGPLMVTGLGMGLTFVPLSLVALAGVAEADSGVAASVLNTGRQVGGSIGLAVLGTVAWTVVANSARAEGAAAARAASPVSSARAASQAAAYQHALAAGFDRAFLVAAGIAGLILVAAIAVIRVRRADLGGRIADS